MIEYLERRRLLAASVTTFRIDDYLPIAGAVWKYTGTDNGLSATQVVSTVRSNQDFTVSSKTNRSGAVSDSYDNHYIISDDGLLLTAEDGKTGSGLEGHIAYVVPVRELAPIVHAGDSETLTDIPVTATFNQDGTVINLTGTETRTTTVIGLDSVGAVTLPGGRFIYGLRIVTQYHRSLAGKLNGKTWTFTDDSEDTEILGKGLGIVSFQSAGTVHFNTGDGDEPEDNSENWRLTSDSLLPAPQAVLDSNGVLSVQGTSGDDVIRVANDIKRTLAVYVNDIGASFGSRDVKSIQIFAGDGGDTITLGQSIGAYVDAGAGNDVVTGSAQADTLTGGAGKDTLDGGAGNDRVNGNGGHDRLIGGEGNDRLYGGNENDTLQGGGGVDRIWGGDGNDLLDGGGSNDKLFAEGGDDSLYGGTANDLLDGGAGSDLLNGGAGDDMLQALDSTPDNIDGGDTIAGNDSVTSDSFDVLEGI